MREKELKYDLATIKNDEIIGHIMNLKDKVVVITGGCKGFGRAMARDFAEEGAKVVISSNDRNELAKTAREISADSFFADVTAQNDIDDLSKYVVNKYGRIDIWVNNAGIQIAPARVEYVDIEKISKLFSVNFFAYFYGCQAALKQMKKQGCGTIMNINSTAGLEGKPELSAYCSSKFALRGLSEVIRAENTNNNISVIDIHPGGMQSDIYKEQVPKDIKEYMLVKDVSRKVIENLKLEKPVTQLIIKRPKK
ncbi:MAG: SDR family oxidoreductase [bacterium]